MQCCCSPSASSAMHKCMCVLTHVLFLPSSHATGLYLLSVILSHLIFCSMEVKGWKQHWQGQSAWWVGSFCRAVGAASEFGKEFVQHLWTSSWKMKTWNNADTCRHAIMRWRCRMISNFSAFLCKKHSSLSWGRQESMADSTQLQPRQMERPSLSTPITEWDEHDGNSTSFFLENLALQFFYKRSWYRAAMPQEQELNALPCPETRRDPRLSGAVGCDPSGICDVSRNSSIPSVLRLSVVWQQEHLKGTRRTSQRRYSAYRGTTSKDCAGLPASPNVATL